MVCIMKQFYCEEICNNDDYKFSPSGLYYAPKHTDYAGYIDYINSLPDQPEPEAFGLHANAAITRNQFATNETLQTILKASYSDVGGADDATVLKLCDQILNDLPKDFDIKEAEKKYPVQYENAMNILFVQELERFNRLTSTIRSQLTNLKKAIQGMVVLS